MSDGWHIATIQPGRGDAVCEQMDRDGFEWWRPMHECWIRKRGTRTRVKVQRPCLPAYLFIALTPRICAARRIFGVTGLITCGSEPAIVADRELDPMRQKIASKEPNGAADVVAFVRGEMLRLLAGPFIGFSARFEEHERHGQIRATVNAFGRATTVHTHVAEVERIG